MTLPLRAAAPAPRVVLHVGAMKTGTSAVQAVLGRHAEALAATGVLYPYDPGWVVQVRAVRDALDVPGVDRGPGRWAAMAEHLRTHDGPLAVLSMEFLSFADVDHARAVVESLAPADVHVVLTLRDASRVLPSAWQEWTQNRGKAPWEKYLAVAQRLQPNSSAGAAVPDSPAAKAYERVLGSERILSAWSRAVPSGHLHVITVPPPGTPPRLLWERFAAVMGIDPTPYELPADPANESIGYCAADLMWRVNRAVADLDFAAYDTVVKHRLCKQVLARRSERAPVPLPESARELALGWAERTAQRIREVGANVVGDLAELEPVPGRFEPGPVPPADPAAVVAVARDALVGLGADADRLADDADVDAAVAAVAARVRVLTAGREAPEDSGEHGLRGLLRSWRGGRRPP